MQKLICQRNESRAVFTRHGQVRQAKKGKYPAPCGKAVRAKCGGARPGQRLKPFICQRNESRAVFTRHGQVGQTDRVNTPPLAAQPCAQRAQGRSPACGMMPVIKGFCAIWLCFLMFGCSAQASLPSGLAHSPEKESQGQDVNVKLVLPGNLNDKGFNTMALKGMEKAKNIFGARMNFEYVELNYEGEKFEQVLKEISAENWDVVVTLSYLMKDPVEKVAPLFPDVTYIIVDTAIDYEYNSQLENVYSAVFRQNECGFLAGALAAQLTAHTEIVDINPQKSISFLGAHDVPIINDFLVGYIDGAQYIDKEVKVDIEYIGSFTDKNKAEQLAQKQFEDAGIAADVGFNVAAEAGLGQVSSAISQGAYVIGVDVDQSLIFENEPEKAKRIVSSVTKNVDVVIYNAMSLYMLNKLPVGQTTSLGLKEGGISLVKNKNYYALVPPTVQQLMLQIESNIADGSINVSTLFPQ